MEKKFKISNEIYEVGKIQEAILDFSDIADISFYNSTLTLSGESIDDIHETFGEFMNYILSM